MDMNLIIQYTNLNTDQEKMDFIISQNDPREFIRFLTHNHILIPSKIWFYYYRSHSFNLNVEGYLISDCKESVISKLNKLYDSELVKDFTIYNLLEISKPSLPHKHRVKIPNNNNKTKDTSKVIAKIVAIKDEFGWRVVIYDGQNYYHPNSSLWGGTDKNDKITIGKMEKYIVLEEIKEN